MTVCTDRPLKRRPTITKEFGKVDAHLITPSAGCGVRVGTAVVHALRLHRCQELSVLSHAVRHHSHCLKSHTRIGSDDFFHARLMFMQSTQKKNQPPTRICVRRNMCHTSRQILVQQPRGSTMQPLRVTSFHTLQNLIQRVLAQWISGFPIRLAIGNLLPRRCVSAGHSIVDQVVTSDPSPPTRSIARTCRCALERHGCLPWPLASFLPFTLAFLTFVYCGGVFGGLVRTVCGLVCLPTELP